MPPDSAVGPARALPRDGSAVALPVTLSLALSTAAGAASAAALPPYGLWPVLFVTIPTLVAGLDAVSQRGRAVVKRGFLAGFLFGSGYFLISLMWIANAFLVEADLYGWMIPFALAGLSAYLAVYWGLATMVTVMTTRPGLPRIAMLAASLALADWLRGHLLSGFPWNTPGYVTAGLPGLAQSAAVVGIYGLSFLVLLCAGLPALAFARPRRGELAVAAVLLAIAAIATLAGDTRLAAPSATPTGLKLRLVQGNVPQDTKWDADQARSIFARYLALSRSGADGGSPLGSNALVIWPESALPFLVDESPVALREIADLLPPGTRLLLGALRRDAGPPQRVYNSIIAIDGDGRIEALYDKVRLVPFGEFLPFSRWLDPIGIRRFIAAPQGFTAGETTPVMHLPGIPPFVPLVCYEAIFPEQANRHDQAKWLLNLTNDAWFGSSSGPYQHLAQARFRAIETGLPMVRVANTGITAIFDGYGRKIGELKLGVEGTMDAVLPQALPETLYARLGDMLFFMAILSTAATAIRFSLRAR
jgi:apolipoprotein N-acyltransferase